MTTLAAQLPTLPDLTAGLAELLDGAGAGDRKLTILGRQRNVHASTFASEIVTYRLAGGSVRRLLCKYGAGPTDAVFGHKGGVVYEAAVYRDVLEPLRDQAATAAFHGAREDPATGLTWLVIEYVEGSARLHLTADPAGALTRAASWLGRFQAAAELRGLGATCFLNSYDREYYLGWAHRTLEFARSLLPRLPWLPGLCRHFEELVERLLTLPPVVVHGEYYPKNVLIRGRCIYPVDWESAAWAAGEIDLATLTEGWPPDVVRRCERAYARARGPTGAPADFAWRLAACRVYGLLRWLGDRPEWTTGRGALRQFKQLRSLGRELGVI
jgi:hypothetical protein